MIVAPVLRVGVFVHEQTLFNAEDLLERRPELLREPAVENEVDGGFEGQKQDRDVPKDDESRRQDLQEKSGFR